MSVGHIARGLEEAGIPTVIIAVRSFKKRMEIMSLPRVLLTDNLLGRVMGGPGHASLHIDTLRKALKLFSAAKENGTIQSMVNESYMVNLTED